MLTALKGKCFCLKFPLRSHHRKKYLALCNYAPVASTDDDDDDDDDDEDGEKNGQDKVSFHTWNSQT